MWSDFHRAMYNRFYIIDISSQILCGINIVTNLAAYLIFYQDRMVSTFNRLLMNLSLCECLFQIWYILYSSVENCLLLQSRLIFSSYSKAVIFSCFYLFVIVPGMTASHIARNWAVILISLYRFETLVRAFSTKWLIFRKGRDIKICVLVFFLSILIAVPRGIERNAFICVSSEDHVAKVNGFGHRAIALETYKYAYVVATLFLFQNGGPAIIVCTIGSLIIIKLADRTRIKERLTGKDTKELIYTKNTTAVPNPSMASELPVKVKAKKNPSKYLLPFFKRELNQSQRKMSRKQQNSSRGGKLVVILSVLFVVCELPSFFNKLFGIFGLFQESVFSEYLVISSNFATLLDSFVNFFIYLLSNQRFRKHLLHKINIVLVKMHCSTNIDTNNPNMVSAVQTRRLTTID